MINLIPPSAKKSLLIEYWVRVASTWLILWSIALLASAAILLPAYVLIGTQVSVYKNSAQEATEKVAGYEDVSRGLVRASQQARVLVDEDSLPVLSEYMTLFEELQGADVQLNQIAISRKEAGFNPITLSGVASDRQALASFRDRLLSKEEITKVDLPISNLARDKDIQFTITVNLENLNIDV